MELEERPQHSSRSLSQASAREPSAAIRSGLCFQGRHPHSPRAVNPLMPRSLPYEYRFFALPLFHLLLDVLETRGASASGPVPPLVLSLPLTCASTTPMTGAGMARVRATSEHVSAVNALP